MKNFIHTTNEILKFAVHLVVIIMCTKFKTENYELRKKILVYCVMIIWIINSAASIITLLLKIIGYIKSKIEGKKVEPEVKLKKELLSRIYILRLLNHLLIVS